MGVNFAVLALAVSEILYRAGYPMVGHGLLGLAVGLSIFNLILIALDSAEASVERWVNKRKARRRVIPKNYNDDT